MDRQTPHYPPPMRPHSAPENELLPATKHPNISDSIIDARGLNFPTGNWGSCVNGQPFQQDALTSFRNFQYAAYFAEGGVLCLGRRRLPGGAWEVIRFGDYRMAMHNDVHNVAVVGICEADGTVHLSFDHHVNTLNYRVSIRGVALEPEGFPWTAELFGPIQNRLHGEDSLEAITYPGFFPTPQGRLQFIYRTGCSGNGDWHMAEYAAGQGWRDLGMLLSGAGTFENCPTRCAYPDPLRYGPDGRLHMTWCWREHPLDRPLDLMTNHELGYAHSDDYGRTWKNNDGVTVARLGTADAHPIRVDSPGIHVAKIPLFWGLMNTTGMHVDHSGMVHVLNWQNPPDAPRPSADLHDWRYVHYWGKAGLPWQMAGLPFLGRKPQICVSASGAVFALFLRGEELEYHGCSDPGGTLCIAMSAAPAGGDWRIVWESEQAFVGEPLWDQARWNQSGVLSIYIQEKPEAAGLPSVLHVLDDSPANNPDGLRA